MYETRSYNIGISSRLALHRAVFNRHPRLQFIERATAGVNVLPVERFAVNLDVPQYGPATPSRIEVDRSARLGPNVVVLDHERFRPRPHAERVVVVAVMPVSDVPQCEIR